MKQKSAWLVLGILAVALFTRTPFISKEFTLEEALHLKVSEAIAQTGYPKIYYSEQNKEGFFLERTPALFIPISIALKLFDNSETTVRSTLLLFSLAEITITMFLLSKIFSQKNGFQIASLTGFFMATSPYLIQTNLQIHFESAIYTLMTTSFMLLALFKISNRKNSWTDHLQLAVIYFFAFFVKYETSLMALTSISIFAFIYFRKFLKKLLISSLLSIVLSQVLFYLYNMAFGHPQLTLLPAQSIFWVFQNVFFPKVTAVVSETQAQSLWANNYYLLIRFLSWISIPAIVLFSFALFQIKASQKLKNNPKIVFFALWFFLFSGVYLTGGWSGDFPRYFATAMPPFFILISAALVLKLNSTVGKISLPKVGFLSFLVVASVVLAKQNDFLFLDHITGWIPNLQIPFFTVAITLIALTIIATKIAWIKIELPIMLAMLYLAQIFFQINHDLKSNYSLTNFYKASHFKDAGLLMRTKIRQNDPILTIDPIAFYFGGKFYDYFSFGTRNRDHGPTVAALSAGTIKGIALPKSTMNDLQITLSKSGIEFTNLIEKNFKNHFQFPGENGVEVYF